MRFWNRTDRTSVAITDWGSLQKLKRKGRLLAVLQSEAAKYTPDDLDIMMQAYDEKIRTLPSDYRDELKRYARIQITNGYNRLITASLDKILRKEKISNTWPAFVVFVVRECMDGNQRLRSLKYLIAAYTMYVEEKPPHPVGMPFPGGVSVECFEGIYYCPVKDSWAGEDHALCRFCSAVQSRDRDMVLSKPERDAVGKKEKINNYFYNFKG
ncbi:MAG TPA: DUF2115 family protein [Methanocorpusculum sp.]|nr:DUF2115 family protein [Methanocorpusculum sp.]